MTLQRLQSLSRGDKPAAAPAEAPVVPLTPHQVIEQTGQEYEQIQKEAKEIEILVKQSSAEVEKLAQRNAQLTNKVRTMEANIDTVPRQDIKEVYNAAQESQMRLFMMRGQVEQLQNRQETIKRYAESLRKVLDISQALIVSGEVSGGPRENVVDSEAIESSGIIKIINAQESERHRLANQLHDGPAQSLTNLILQAEICERLFDINPVRARSELSELKQAVTNSFQKVREFIFDLRPMMLDDLGLPPTLKKSVEAFEQKNGIACNVTISGRDMRLPPHTEVTIFRVIQGLLKNVRDHASATHVQIMLNISDDRAIVTVEDDGGGFDVPGALTASRQRKTIGLSSMQEQIAMLGGQIQIDSAVGKGTRVEFWMPAA